MNGYNFTERVRKVLALAREQAFHLHHEYVGAEHILLGLIAEGEGIAMTVIRDLSVEPAAVRQRLLEFVKAGGEAVRTGPDLPYTSRAKKVLELAMAEARELSHEYVGTEHLLLGLLREGANIAAQVLIDSGITLDRARAEVLRLLGTPSTGARARAKDSKSLLDRIGNRVEEAFEKLGSAADAVMTSKVVPDAVMSVMSAPGRAPSRSLREGQFIPLAVGDGTSMQGYVVRPVSAGRKPGLIVFQEAFGVNAHIRDVATRFAAQGFVVVAPELYHRTGTHVEGSYDNFAALGPHFQALTTDGMAADARAAHAWLAADPEVGSSRIAAIGYCMGGRAAFIANSELPLAASVSYYGGGIAPSLLDRVSRLHGPQLLCWGGKDTHIAPEQTRAIDDALRAAGKPYTTVTFGEADHGFFCDQRSAYHPDVAAEAWALTIAFLARTTGIAAPRT
jgi:carboxymethylenebutenolidase